jgi:IS1 family transposase
MFFYATDSYAVYPKFIDEADQIASKSYMTRVEGENTKFLALLSTIAYKNSLLL